MALPMALPFKHPKTGVYWLRKRVPHDLRPILGKTEEKRSLGTRDPKDARLAAAKMLADLEERWANLRAGPKTLTEREAHDLAATIYAEWLAIYRDNPSEQTAWFPEHFEILWKPALVPAVTNAVDLILSPLNDPCWAVPAMEQICRERTEALLLAKGLRLDRVGQRRVQTAVAAAIQRASLELKEFGLGYAAGAQRAVEASLASKRAASLPLQELLDGWKAERRPMAKTVYEYTRVVRDLKAHLGHDDARRITGKDLVAWKASMVEAELAPKTIRDAKLAPIRAIMQWGADNELLPLNPAARVSIDVKVRAADSKRGFDDKEAGTILSAAKAEIDPVRRWVPLLGAYSGARVSELCQLRCEDILQIENVWCMKFVPEAGSLKTRGSERIVPLHQAVIDAGFLKFVEKGKVGPLFPDLAPDKFGKRGGNGTKVIGRWVRGLGLTDLRLSPSHSWRHRFKTLGRRHGLMPDIVNAITGHHRKTVADSYGEFPVESLYREILKIPSVSA